MQLDQYRKLAILKAVLELAAFSIAVLSMVVRPSSCLALSRACASNYGPIVGLGSGGWRRVLREGRGASLREFHALGVAPHLVRRRGGCIGCLRTLSSFKGGYGGGFSGLNGAGADDDGGGGNHRQGDASVFCKDKFVSYAGLPARNDMTLPDDLAALDPAIHRLKTLSPSAILEYKACKMMFYFKYLLKVRDKVGKPALVKGTLVHKALEEMYKLNARDRMLPVVHDILRREWSNMKSDNSSVAKEMFEGDLQGEIKWGREALALIDNYYALEDPSLESPCWLERWVSGPVNNVTVRGIVDRMDLCRGDGDGAFRIVDYKTGKAPDPRYTDVTDGEGE